MVIYSLGGSRLYRYLKVILTALLPLILWLIPPGWLNEQHSICLFKNLTGQECLGCGMTRAVVSVLHFRFNEAFLFNKSVILVFPLLIFIWAKTLLASLKDITSSSLKDPENNQPSY
jgi:hypothetical protein